VLVDLLDRAADIGLLDAQGGGYYRIHPALPWFFRRLFERYYPCGVAEAPHTGQVVGGGLGEAAVADAEAATNAYCAAIAGLGDYYHKQYQEGHREVIDALRAEEANLLHAWRLARGLEIWGEVIGAMQGLEQLYDHTGRRTEWAALVAKVLPDLVDGDEGPLPGREGEWSLITQYRVLLAREARDWDEAERLQRRAVAWDREHAKSLLEVPVDGLDAEGRNRLRTLAVSLEQLGQIQRKQERPECVSAYEEALELYVRIGDTSAEAVCAFNLGHIYKNIPALRDLDQAEHWYRCSLDLHAESDHIGRAKCQNELG
jgi:tetratricopeptide (TPR) repeat protein